MVRKKTIKGERLHGKGWQAYVTINGEFIQKTFPLDSTPAQRETWRIAQKHKTAPAPPVGSLGRDSARWLHTQKHTPDYPNKRTYITRWLQRLGRTTPRRDITSGDIEAVLSDLLHEGFSPTTVRHHRTALKKLWEFCDGKKAPNPIDETTRPQDHPAEVRTARLEDVQRVIAHLRPGKTRARLMLILATGLPHKQIMRLTPADWDKAGKTLIARPRRKGRGAPARIVPLGDDGMAAMKVFNLEDAWGNFSPSAMHSAVHRACKTLGIPPFRPYDIRHLFGARVYRLTGDLTTVARLLGHADIRTSARYAAAAFTELDRAVIDKLKGESE
jgi:integrase